LNKACRGSLAAVIFGNGSWRMTTSRFANAHGRRIARLCLAAALALAQPAAADDGPLIAAASDLRYALPEIAEAFAAEAGVRLRLTFGSSGNLRRQIEQGAPFEVFLSADEGYALALAESGHAVDKGALYAEGHIVLFAPARSALAIDGALAGLAEALKAGRISRFAIANPEHAPYGRAAREALTGAGLWDAVRPYLVLGENVSQAAQFALAGGADGAILPLSLVGADPMKGQGRFALIPGGRHAPLLQRMVLIKGAGAGARRFYGFMQSPAALAILARHGFQPPPR
jgi:molybdate transport system substrate-binding protein